MKKSVYTYQETLQEHKMWMSSVGLFIKKMWMCILRIFCAQGEESTFLLLSLKANGKMSPSLLELRTSDEQSCPDNTVSVSRATKTNRYGVLGLRLIQSPFD